MKDEKERANTRISLCIATFNEENFLHYPLDSAINLADEVVIVDGTSTDKTVEKAKSYGRKVTVYVEDNPKIFHINKQKALDRASGDWILQLDADEALSEELKEEVIRTIKLHKEGDPVAYWLPRKNFFLTRFLTKGGQYPDYTIRLYKRGVAHFPCKTVHENVEVKGQVGYLTHPLLHYADPTFERYLKRWHRYNDLDVQFLLQEGRRPNMFTYLIWKPFSTFFAMYLRHKGFMDGIPGLIFAFFSSIRYWEIYRKARAGSYS